MWIDGGFASGVGGQAIAVTDPATGEKVGEVPRGLPPDIDFGLASTLMTRDAALAKRFFEQVQSGTVYIKDPLTPNVAAPFGGMKRSGLGRELGAEGFSEFCQPKHVHWDLLGRRKDSWISN
jgi:acyl-CoA reductase-like NAD-dependent aldehyde dehydrogenase